MNAAFRFDPVELPAQCAALSEPDSGSDLASIRTRAVPVADGYEVTGAKVWTSYAHESHFAITLVRTPPAEANRHRGLSRLILDLKGAGCHDPADHQPRRRARLQRDVLDRVFVPADRLVGVAEIAHQVHGAIGFTHEHSLHRLTRRLWSWRDEFGTEAHWSRELGRAVMAAGPDALWPTITAP